MQSFRDALNRAGMSDRPLTAGRLAGWYGLNRPISLSGLAGTAQSPAEVTFHGDVVTPSGTALGGWVEMTLRSDGTYTFKGHMHDSGWDPYDFRVQAVVSTPNIAVAAQRSGHTDGTGSDPFGSPNRDFDWQEDGSDARIETFWTEVRQGTMSVSKSYEDVGVLKTVEDIIADFLGFVAADVLGSPVLGLALVIGSELGNVTGLKWGDPTILVGVAEVAGIMAVFGFGALIPAIGVAIATAPNHRRLTQDEIAFAGTVFGDTLPLDRILLTDMASPPILGGRGQFTFPNVDGDILVNLGAAYTDPMHYTDPLYYPAQGEVLIHELVHTWQIANSWLVPGLACGAVGAKMQGSSAYNYGPAGPPYSSFGIEAQAAIVDRWFYRHAAGWISTEDLIQKLNASAAKSDPYFMYIANNIRLGQG
jgi:hypothetical protein